MSGVLETLRAEAADDDGSLGLLLTGSRAVGLDDESSDDDVVWVLTDAAYDARSPRQHLRALEGGPDADIAFTSPRLLADVAAGLQRELEARVERLMEERDVLAHRESTNGLARAKRG